MRWTRIKQLNNQWSIARARSSRPRYCPFRTGLSARRYLLSNGSSFGEGLRGPKGFEGEFGLEPLCCGEVRTFHQSYAYKTGTVRANIVSKTAFVTCSLVRGKCNFANSYKSSRKPHYTITTPTVLVLIKLLLSTLIIRLKALHRLFVVNQTLFKHGKWLSKLVFRHAVW